METAKRRVVYTLWRLGIAPPSMHDSKDGVHFDFLALTAEQKVMTGHEDGVVTLNILEADDDHRERTRALLGEPYRTPIGHLRHELGHYYWDRFFAECGEGDPLMQEWRELFRDERADYGKALEGHYANGPANTWQSTHITAYATAHPWEDWAETWAH